MLCSIKRTIDGWMMCKCEKNKECRGQLEEEGAKEGREEGGSEEAKKKQSENKMSHCK